MVTRIFAQALFYRPFEWSTTQDQPPPGDDHGTTDFLLIPKPDTHPKPSIGTLRELDLSFLVDALAHKLFSINSICLILFWVLISRALQLKNLALQQRIRVIFGGNKKPMVLTTYLRHGFDFGKCDQFFLIIDSIINEESTVDVTAQALGPLLAVKGLHAHSHFNTAEGDTGGGQRTRAHWAFSAHYHHLLLLQAQKKMRVLVSSVICKSMQLLKSISPGWQMRCASSWGHFCFTFPLPGGKKASCEFIYSVYIHEYMLAMGRGV